MGTACYYTNFLFDLSSDPHERSNLWDSPDHDEIKAALIARAEELASAQGDYGKIIPEMYSRAPSQNMDSAFRGNGDYVVPWECEVVP